MTRRTVSLMSAGVCLLVAGVWADEPAPSNEATARKEYERTLLEAEEAFFQQKLAAHESYVRSLTEARRAAVAAGDLDEARRLEDREKEIRAHLKSDGEQLLVKRHRLASPAVVSLHGDGFELKTLRVGATAFSNRDYKWRKVPEVMRGWRFTQIAGGDTPDIRVEVKHPGVVYVMAESTELAEQGWTARDDLRFHWYPDREPMSVYGKEFKAGQVVRIPHDGWTGTIVLLPFGTEPDRTAVQRASVEPRLE
ncbi:MAG: hypothetical protein WBC44_00850 [Planctomycetaceae bacterium]